MTTQTRHFRTLGTATPAAIRAFVCAPATARVETRREHGELVAVVSWDEDAIAEHESRQRVRYAGRRWYR